MFEWFLDTPLIEVILFKLVIFETFKISLYDELYENQTFFILGLSQIKIKKIKTHRSFFGKTLGYISEGFLEKH